MKRAYLYFIGFILMLTANFCKAQTLNLKPAPAGITIDGNAKEWGLSLPYSNDKAKVNYMLSNDRDNIYLVVETKDTAMQSNILGSGITLSINTKDSKTPTQTITFPERGKEDPSEYRNMDSAQTQVKIILTKYRKVKVTGFTAITDNELSTSNPYGIQIAMGYNDAGYLIYEEAIPLTLFGVGDLTDKEWALNIKFNGLERSIRNQKFHAGVAIKPIISDGNNDASSDNNTVISGTNALPDSGIPPHDTVAPISEEDFTRGLIRLTPAVDFWVKFNLAKIP
jgi:hypothetical protein